MDKHNLVTEIFDKFNPVFGLSGRIFMALIFLVSGYGKIGGYAGTQGYMEAMGVPGALLPVVILIELVGGAAIIMGWQVRIIALLMAGYCLLTGALFHFQPADQVQFIMFLKNLAMAGGFLFLVQNGAGTLSVDNRNT